MRRSTVFGCSSANGAAAKEDLVFERPEPGAYADGHNLDGCDRDSNHRRRAGARDGTARPDRLVPGHRKLVALAGVADVGGPDDFRARQILAGAALQPANSRSMSGGSERRQRNRDVFRQQHPQRRKRARIPGTRTVRMPSSGAISQACSPPQPPNATSAKSRGSWPRSTDTTRIARSILALATRRMPCGRRDAADPSCCAIESTAAAARAVSRCISPPIS